MGFASTNKQLGELRGAIGSNPTSFLRVETADQIAKAKRARKQEGAEALLARAD